MKGDNYWQGRHFWAHFWCGLVAGIGLGISVSWGRFEGPWGFIALTATIALIFAFCAGKWGDPFWHWFLDN